MPCYAPELKKKQTEIQKYLVSLMLRLHSIPADCLRKLALKPAAKWNPILLSSSQWNCTKDELGLVQIKFFPTSFNFEFGVNIYFTTFSFSNTSIGHITAKAICLEDHRTRVNSSFCGPRMKPLTETKLCNTNPCPAQ